MAPEDSLFLPPLAEHNKNVYASFVICLRLTVILAPSCAIESIRGASRFGSLPC